MLPGASASATRLPGPGGVSDGRKGAHGGEAILDARSNRRDSVEDDVGETFNLAAERVPVGAEQPVILVVACQKTFHLARFEVPGIETLGDHAPLFTVDLESLVPLHPYWNGQVQMAERPVGELN